MYYCEARREPFEPYRRKFDQMAQVGLKFYRKGLELTLNVLSTSAEGLH